MNPATWFFLALVPPTVSDVFFWVRLPHVRVSPFLSPFLTQMKVTARFVRAATRVRCLLRF
jgi:hypothetical protein